jgi:ribosome-interacting GTPase 1
MPANLTPQYFEAERAYRSAVLPEEKILALENMLSVMPKHKGTDHLRAELTAKIARLNELLDKTAGPGRHRGGYHIRKEGVGQVALVGFTNSGKTSLVSTLSSIPLRSGDYSFVTKEPASAMMRFENVLIQLVDMPAIEYQEARPWLASILRNADLILLTIDLSRESLSVFQNTNEKLKELKIAILNDPSPITTSSVISKKALVVGTKSDSPGGFDQYRVLEDAVSEWLTTYAFSVLEPSNLEDVKHGIYQKLEIIRVYTKPPGQTALLSNPTVMPIGSTVLDVASAVHKDFVSRVKYAQVWGSSKFPGQKVSREYVLCEGDIVELHV